MIKKFYFILGLFFVATSLAPKACIQCGKSNSTVAIYGNPIININTIKNVTFVTEGRKNL